MYHFEYNLIAENDADFQSEAIASVAYNRDNSEMAVEFIDGDNLYVYSGVTESTYNLFVGAESLGKFYRTAIQGNFTSEAHFNGTLVSAEGEQVEDTLADWERELLNATTPEPLAEVIPIERGEPIFSTEGARRLLDVINSLKAYDIKWTGSFGDSDERTGPFVFSTQAVSEDEAIETFDLLTDELLGSSATIKIVSVTRHFG